MIEGIDLHRHAVLEASAGTGKTYTIERLVLRLLLEKNVPLENILLVTFTEKATGELKSRLRSVLEKTVEESDEPLPLLQAGLDGFDQAPIFTIHGFCQRLLQEYSLEKGQDFRPTLVSDNDLIGPALQEIQRRTWVRDYGKDLGEVLKHAGYDRKEAEGWEGEVRDLASRFRPECGHILIPQPVSNWVEAWRNEPTRADAGWEHQLLVHTLHAVQHHLREKKRQHGEQSFDDMIARVDQGLGPDNPRAPVLLRMLRERFRYAIVDEFQDTDPIQWRIFRRLFLEGGNSPLFIVGDPKQAIYGFRGADLPTYLMAAKEMTESFGAQSFPLTINWRSSQELLDALNAVFDDGQFFKDTGIQYVRVQAPAPEQRQAVVTSDESSRCALTVVDLTESDKLSTARIAFGNFIAREIRQLLYGAAGKPTLEVRIKHGQPRPIHAGDIGILVHRRRDALHLTDALSLAGIPFSFYRQAGLWQSDEAEQVGILLRCLLRPEETNAFHRALLTRFFRIDPGELIRHRDVPGPHPARRLFQTWTVFAQERRWADLFQSLLEHTGISFDSLGHPNFERQEANFRALFETLEQKAYGDNLDLLGLYEYFQERKASRADTDTQPMDTDLPKVKIMTIHSAKGLEFPIVFMAGGITAPKSKNICMYRNEEGRLVYDLPLSGKAKTKLKGDLLQRYAKSKKEEDSEARRLLYVAMTRAMFKLYVPLIVRPPNQWNGPAVTILAPALESAGLQHLPDQVKVVFPEDAMPVPPPSEDVEPAVEAAPTPQEPIQLEELLLPVDEHLAQRRIVVRSFSSLHRMRLQREEASIFGDRPIRNDEVSNHPPEKDDPLRGAVFGDLVHNVLENIDWTEVGLAKQAEDLLEPGRPSRRVLDDEIRVNLHKFPTRLPLEVLNDMCLSSVSRLVWNALHTPLPEVGPLWQIPLADRLQELEFHFPHLYEGETSRLREEGFFTGYMDLVFRKAGRFYLLDWKTNLLPEYSPDELERSMQEADYHRQYRLYLQALARWLGRMQGDRFDFQQQIGGVFYLYVRGLTGQDASPGIFFRKPGLEEITLQEILK